MVTSSRTGTLLFLGEHFLCCGTLGHVLLFLTRIARTWIDGDIIVEIHVTPTGSFGVILRSVPARISVAALTWLSCRYTSRCETALASF